MTYDARDIANFLLDSGDEAKVGLSQIALQKIIFFSHGWYLAFAGKELVQNEFEAWDYGPVIPVLWKEFRAFRQKPITSRASFLNPLTGERFTRPHSLAKDDVVFLQNLLKYYSQFPAYALSDLSHQIGMPWRIVRDKMGSTANLGAVIDNGLIRETFHSFRSECPVPGVDPALTTKVIAPTLIATGGDAIRPN